MGTSQLTLIGPCHWNDPATMTEPLHLSDRAGAARSSEIRDLLRLADRPGTISLAGGLPDPAGFPIAAMRAAADRALAAPGPSLQYGATDGDRELRALLAARHAATTGRPTEPEEVLVTTGSQQGLDLLARALADPGETALVEDPTYLGALQALRAGGVTTEGTHRDDDGLDTDALAARLADRSGPPVRLVYTVPTFANPTGTTMPADRRRHLASLADRHGILVIEDSPYADLRFRGEVVAPVATHSDRVITLGTVSKTLAPGLRVGWMIGPTAVVEAVGRLKQAVDLHTSGLTQRITLDLLSRPEWFDTHVAGLAQQYGERAAALRASLVEHLGDRLDLTDPDGGMFLWATPRPDTPTIDTRALLPLAIAAGTAFVPGDAFAADLSSSHGGSMRLSFATAPPDDLVRASERLASAVDQLDGRSRPKMSLGPLSHVR
jgi:2-aminoadipate transaminase